ncbi:hypothetical protein [Nonomuraea sp. SYSU D8015]|uniref:hypothetical protein n=1 Tax=Nonomuraea sp. SYSU D8015 TaxID=2593644 RepID=UPI0016618905|nr:hypothetical protein [Nonomuraea sp. SYSU D8015]
MMLTLAPSPGPGPLGTRRLLAWSAAAFAAVVAAPLVSAAAIVLFLVTALVMALRSPVGRRTAVALVPLLLVFAGGLPGAGDLTNLAALGTVSAVVLGLTAWLARTGEATSSPADG